MHRYASMGTRHDLVSVSVKSQSSVEMDERTELVFGMGASFHLFYTCTLCYTLELYYYGLRKYCFSMSVVETCYQHSLRKVDAHSMVNWTVVSQLN